MKPRLIALLLATFLPAVLLGETRSLPVFKPVPVSDGPVLMFKQPKKNSDELALYLFDPALHKKPRLLWQERYHPNPRNLRRLDDEQVLFDYKNQLHLAALSTARITPLLAGNEQTKFVSLESDTIFFFKRSVPEKTSDLGIALTTGKDQKTVVENYFRPRDFLFRHKVGGDGSKAVSPVAIETLLETNEKGFLVITANQPQQIALISREGKLTKICPFDSRWIATMTTHAFSPSGDFLALSILASDQDFHEERTLLVCDLRKGGVSFTDRNIPLGPSLFSGRSNFLDLVWRTDHVLQYGGVFALLGKEGEQPRFVNLSTGKPLIKETQSKLPAAVVEEIPERERRGEFELKFGEVYFPGEEKPIASVLNEKGVGTRDLAVDSKGSLAAYSERRDDRIYLINGTARSKMSIHSGWAHDLKWLEVESRK